MKRISRKRGGLALIAVGTGPYAVALYIMQENPTPLHI
jgi:hypothetical protein